MTPPPLFEEDSFVVAPVAAGGEMIYRIDIDNFNVAVGDTVPVPIVLDMTKYSKFSIHHFIDQDILLHLGWINSPEGGLNREKTIMVNAILGEGGIVEGRVHAQKMSLQIINNSMPGPGSEINTIYFAVFGIK